MKKVAAFRAFGAALIVMAFFGTGCPSPTGQTPGDGASNGTPVARVVLDSGSRIQTEITAAGGTLQIIDTEGNTFTLIIPEGAVHREQIAITKIASLSGVAVGPGVLLGIDIQPDGLHLMKPATLVIEPADVTALHEYLSYESALLLTGFKYRDTGAGFHYYPYLLHPDGSSIRIPVTRFSGYGLSTSSESQRQQQNGYPLPSAQDRAHQELSAILRDEARRLFADPDYTPTPDATAAVFALFEAWLDDYIFPLAREAATNDSFLDCAIMEWRQWEAAAQFFGVFTNPAESPFADRVAQIELYVTTGLDNAALLGHARAVAYNDASQIMRLYELDAVRKLLGFTSEIDYWEILMKITRFTLRFESHVNTVPNHDLNFQIGVQTDDILLQLDPQDGWMFLTGEGPINHTGVTGSHLISYSTEGCTFAADYVHFAAPPYAHRGCDGFVLPQTLESRGTMFMAVTPGLPKEQMTFRVPGHDDHSFTLPMEGYWLGGFVRLNQDIYNPELGFEISDWNMHFGAPYATKVMRQVDEYVSAVTTFTLWYSPLEP